MDIIDQSDFHESDMLNTLTDLKLVLQRHGDKSNLYRAYRTHVEMELRILKKEMDDSKLSDIERFPGITGSLESLEEMLNSYDKNLQDDLGGSIIKEEILREMERCDTIFIFMFENT
jgi:hypothetical protein